MSTRCQIGFYEKEETDLNRWRVLLYQHSDGYPGTPDGKEYGALAGIISFLKKFSKKRELSDIEYVSARLLQFLCNEYDKEVRSDGFNGTLGYGICSEFHGDIEYYYAVFPNMIKVYKVSFDSECESWKLINTIKLGRKE